MGGIAVAVIAILLVALVALFRDYNDLLARYEKLKQVHLLREAGMTEDQGIKRVANEPDPEQGDGGSTPSRDIQGGREGELATSDPSYGPGMAFSGNEEGTGEVQSASSYEAGNVGSYPTRASAYEKDDFRVLECPHCGGEFRDE